MILAETVSVEHYYEKLFIFQYYPPAYPPRAMQAAVKQAPPDGEGMGWRAGCKD